ncbi:hypothetical protein B9Z55_000710 [Caenorhabditis nigoni]|uniref:Uncharacterized protein n=1 Tax=Caenorhabditis nigoni TaxID=1611254 RepID=A0A2G5VV48_9PELO|nr:hypothetical protein B9Z55_000710 [Caenorhabditis nigoni]
MPFLAVSSAETHHLFLLVPSDNILNQIDATFRKPTSYAPSSQQESKMKKGSKAVKTIKIREITENCKSLLFPNSEIAMLPGSICR